MPTEAVTVVRERAVAGLKEQIAAAPAAAAAATPSSATNPTYVQLQIRLQATVADMQSMQAKHESLRKSLMAYDTAIASTPNPKIWVPAVANR